jgi:hypothetical protein
MSGDLDDDVTVMNAVDLGELLDLTPRRIRQLAEEGRLVRRGRGLFDATHAIHTNAGTALLGQGAARGQDKLVLAAVGWLASFLVGKAKVSLEDVAAFKKGAGRWGLDDDGAMMVIARACALLGEAAPDFEAGHRR